MKKLLMFTFVLFLSLNFMSLSAQENVNDFEFKLFEADYYLTRQDNGVGAMRIEEKLVAQFPLFNQNRGILRSIPMEYKNNSLNLEILSVTNEDNQPWNYTAYESGGQLVVRIGDADKYVRGEQEYNITYTVSNVITFFDDYDELFWDTNGTGWSQPFEQVVARFHVPNSLTDALRENQVCYSGAFRSQAQNCDITTETTDDGVVVTATAEDLLARENLSVALAFESGTFNADPWIAIRRTINIGALVLIPLLAMAYAYREWMRNGRDVGRRGYVTPQYDPPKDLNLLEAEVILEEKLTTNGISATILDLATSGYIQIIQKEKKKLFGKDNQYTLKLIKNPAGLPTNIQKVLDMLFESKQVGEEVNLDENKNKFYKDAQNLIKSVPKLLSSKHYFRSDPSKARSLWVVKITAFAVIGVITTRLFLGDDYALVTVAFVVAGVLMAFWTKAMPARTKKGSEMYEYLLGLKDYIELAEKDRLEFHQSPEGSRYGGKEISDKEFKLNLYEKLLPYAMLFGLAEKWSEDFKDIYDSQPEWYQSDGSAFNTIYLANSLNSMNASASQAFSPPSNSSSSGGSGFSGGGFSGGGGGGGGGGGW